MENDDQAGQAEAVAMTMRFVSVCSGIEAASVAWEPLGMEPLAFSEIEAFPRAMLAHRYPHVTLHGDFTVLRDQPWIVDADILVGGTPCQGFSLAGLRGSLSDDRSNLCLEFVRLADAIDDLRRDAGRAPAWITWENVPGVFSTDDNAFGTFLAGLVGHDTPIPPPRGRGWTRAGVVSGPKRCAAWRVLDAQHFGLAQRRERVFVLARGGAGDRSAADALLPVIESLCWHPAPRREAGTRPAGSLSASLGRRCGVPDGGDTHGQLVAFGGNNTTGPRHVATAINAKGGAGRMDFESETLICGTLNANGKEAGSATQQDAECGMLIAHTLRAEGFDASEDGTGRGIPLVPVAFDLRGREGGSQFEGPHDTANIRAASGGSSRSYVAGTRVRRLTVTECERLQGFPDDWTAVPFRGKLAADGPRYRALGNSMAVPVMAYIGRAILAEETRNG